MHRMNFSVFGLGLIAVCQLAAPLNGQAQPFVTHQLKPNVYFVEGGGGRSGVIVGNTGVIVIDAKTTLAGGKELLESIAKITPKPVTTVILTHSDGDHVNGLVAFPTGLTIIAQENNKKEQEAAIAKGGPGAPPADHLPTKLVKNKETLTIDGVKLELRHWAPAHTSGDLVVFLPEQKIVFAGDLLTENPYPLIHREKNGDSAGWVESAKGMIAFNADTYVTGHGKIATKADLQKDLTAAEERKAAIKKMIGEGKSLQEIKDAFGEKPQPPAGPGPPRFPTYTETTYQELTGK
jgi:glyoxylase-like metal-dependent hydrolase (beta-lactamase superfamily II)